MAFKLSINPTMDQYAEPLQHSALANTGHSSPSYSPTISRHYVLPYELLSVSVSPHSLQLPSPEDDEDDEISDDQDLVSLALCCSNGRSGDDYRRACFLCPGRQLLYREWRGQRVLVYNFRNFLRYPFSFIFPWVPTWIILGCLVYAEICWDPVRLQLDLAVDGLSIIPLMLFDILVPCCTLSNCAKVKHLATVFQWVSLIFCIVLGIYTFLNPARQSKKVVDICALKGYVSQLFIENVCLWQSPPKGHDIHIHCPGYENPDDSCQILDYNQNTGEITFISDLGDVRICAPVGCHPPLLPEYSIEQCMKVKVTESCDGDAHPTYGISQDLLDNPFLATCILAQTIFLAVLGVKYVVFRYKLMREQASVSRDDSKNQMKSCLFWVIMIFFVLVIIASMM